MIRDDNRGTWIVKDSDERIYLIVVLVIVGMIPGTTVRERAGLVRASIYTPEPENCLRHIYFLLDARDRIMSLVIAQHGYVIDKNSIRNRPQNHDDSSDGLRWRVQPLY